MKANPAIPGGLKLNSIRMFWERREPLLGVDPKAFLGASEVWQKRHTKRGVENVLVDPGTDHADWEQFRDAVRMQAAPSTVLVVDTRPRVVQDPVTGEFKVVRS